MNIVSRSVSCPVSDALLLTPTRYLGHSRVLSVALFFVKMLIIDHRYPLYTWI